MNADIAKKRFADFSVMPDDVVLESVSCPLNCKAPEEKILNAFDRINGIGGVYSIYKCVSCGLMRTNPRPTPETVGAYYPDTYGPYQTDQHEILSKKVTPIWKERLKRFMGRDLRRLPNMPPGHILEIGCASGSYLQSMRNRGWTVEGIEFSLTAASNARKLDIHVQSGSIEQADSPLKKPNVIAAWMVLEHLHDPLKALNKLHLWLEDDGYLVGVVPDSSSWELQVFGASWYALHMPAHLFHYTPTTLKKVLNHAGWKVVKLRWQPSCVNLLNTLEFWCEEKQHTKALASVQWFKRSKKTKVLRKILGWSLGMLRQSGRMEFWAVKQA